MKIKEIKFLLRSCTFIIAFFLWTVLIQISDVQYIGVNGTRIGFATLNKWFHSLTGVNMLLYTITDWLGLVPIFVCMFFGLLGFVQLVKRKSFIKVDIDIIVLGIYYVIVILCYLLFEMIPINYRPVLINGFIEASYPSSTTLLVLCVMPTLNYQVNNRLKRQAAKKFISLTTILFSVFMVTCRLISGVHWITDIVGAILLSAGLFYMYIAVVKLKSK